jgi:hypothetical protein
VAESDFSTSRCPVCSKNIPSYFRHTVKVPEGSFDPNEFRGRWLYSGRNDGWWYYSKEHSEELEKGWKEFNEAGTAEMKISILGRNYFINFQDMTQSSTCGGITRKIQREDSSIPTTIKGVAGVQIVPPEEMPSSKPNEEDSQESQSSQSTEEEDSDSGTME